MLSAHRDPRGVAEYASTAAMRGTRVLMAGPRMAAALPGVVAAYTDLPVIGVPLTSSKSVMGGLDALLSIVQMPPEFRWRASRSTARATRRSWRRRSWPRAGIREHRAARSPSCSLPAH